MYLLSQVYEKSREVLTSQHLSEDWSEIEKKLKFMLLPDGPSISMATATQNLRDKIKSVAQENRSTKAAEIIKAAKPDDMHFQERVALIQFAKHFYLMERRGSQYIWIYDNPRAATSFPFEEYSHGNIAKMQLQISNDKEVFGETNRKIIASSLQLSRKWAMDVYAKTSTPNQMVLEKAKRWFHFENDSDEAIFDTLKKLNSGFKKIAAACNSNRIIFSDNPTLRTIPDFDDTSAAIHPEDTLKVIYLLDLFIKDAQRRKFSSIPKIWMCALTIIHEISHLELGTIDIQYDNKGLSCKKLPKGCNPLQNADNWAYFAADIVDALSPAALRYALK